METGKTNNKRSIVNLVTCSVAENSTHFHDSIETIIFANIKLQRSIYSLTDDLAY